MGGGGYSFLASRSKAFTLAEVLITLGIIGVVAALTIPTLVKNYEKKITVTRLEKTYSMLSQAIKMAQAEHGDVDTWNFSLTGQEFFDTYFFALKKNSKVRFDTVMPEYKLLNGDSASAYALIYYHTHVDVIMQSSGVWIMYFYDNTTHSDSRIMFYIDINGPQKPNQFGKDLFELFLLKDGRLIFYQREDGEDAFTRRNRNELTGTHSYACNKAKAGIWCGALIQLDGWQIKDDYPW